MSDVVETAAPAVEQTPVVEATEAAKPSEATAESEPNGTVKPSEAEATAVSGDAAPVPAKEETAQADKSEQVVEATPASEGILGYKSSNIIPKFRFHEHYFWFTDAPSTPESLASYVRGRDLKSAHPNAAWAQETGKGLLFYAKRAEDKSSPAGIINLSDATIVTIDNTDEFFFRAQGHKHAFQAKGAADRSSWVVAIEKKIEEAKAIKDDIHGSEGYKKHIESYAKTPALAAVATAVTSKHEASTSGEPKKSTEATHATNSATKDVVGGDGTNEEKKGKDTKSRSQSRKRGSIFGTLLGKKDEKEEQKEVKKEEEKEEKAEKKEEVKEDKEQEANATSEPSTAAEAAATAAVGAAVSVTEEKKHDKPETEATTPTTEKKSKRGSIFGSLFSKKDATSPTTEKAEKEDGPSVPAKDAEVPPVSETAPKIEEPIANKPIDTAAVTAPIDTVQTPAAAEETSSETPKETAAAETATTPTKKSGFRGFIKKEAAKLEGKKEVKKEETADKKEDKPSEDVTKDSVPAPSNTESPAATTEETAAATTEEAKPADKRRSSLFGNLGGTIRKKAYNTDSTADAEATEAGTKRERSPLPQRIGSLFRRPSRGVKSEEPKEATASASDSAPAAETTSAPVIKDESAITNGTSATETPGSAIVGDVPDNLHSTIQDAVTAPEVKASA